LCKGKQPIAGFVQAIGNRAAFEPPFTNEPRLVGYIGEGAVQCAMQAEQRRCVIYPNFDLCELFSSLVGW
jgi:hypothetical protein